MKNIVERIVDWCRDLRTPGYTWDYDLDTVKAKILYLLKGSGIAILIGALFTFFVVIIAANIGYGYEEEVYCALIPISIVALVFAWMGVLVSNEDVHWVTATFITLGMLSEISVVLIWLPF